MGGVKAYIGVRMNRSFAALRTSARPCDTPCPSCAGGVCAWSMFSLVGVLPSSRSAAAADCSAALFAGLIGTTTPSDSSPPCVPDVRIPSSPAGLRLPAASDEVSRFSCMQFLSVPGVYDYVGSPALSRYRWRPYCLPLLSTGSASQTSFSKLNTQPTDASCLRFDGHLAIAAARLEVRWFATPFL